MEKVLSQHFHLAAACDLKQYLKDNGYSALKKVLKKEPLEIIEEVKKSGLRGRGGAGFPTGLKWSFVPKVTDKAKYLVCNADESEPGTCKDTMILEKDPHLLLEGIAIAAYAIGAATALVYIRGEFLNSYRILQAAIDEAKEKKYLGKNILGSDFNLNVLITRGAGAYICGEETSQLESLEGKRGYPRNKPPFPAVEGFLQCPTVVNNVETLANLPYIINNGADNYRQIGTAKSTGTRLFGVSGHVENPGVFERPINYSLKKLIEEDAGGVWQGRKLKAVIPGGSSVPVLKAEECDINLDFEAVAAAGSMSGSGGVIVMDETTDMLKVIINLTHFYADESCGQCTPCREGTKWMLQILQNIERGKGRQEDLQMLLDICDNIMGKTVCPLGDAAAMPVQSFVQKFGQEFFKG